MDVAESVAKLDFQMAEKKAVTKDTRKVEMAGY